MATVLLTYEFGSGLGHVNRLIAVARRLGPEHRLVFALPHSEDARPGIAAAFGNRAVVRPAVQWPVPTDPGASLVPTHTFADVLRLFGFGAAALLGSAVERWRRLVDDVAPELIIADFAPTLQIAVPDAPILVVGNGYTVPPSGFPLPPMRPWENAVPAASRANEAGLLEGVNRIRARDGGPAVNHLADLFSGRSTFVCTLREFDPYAPHRVGPVTFPFNVPHMPVGPPAAQRNGPTIFAYLPATHPCLDTVLAALSRLGERAHVYVTGANSHALARRCRANVAFLTKPADFPRVIPQARLLIHHGGLGTAYGGLAAGTPQLLLPVNLEHLITSRALASAGVALGFNKPPPEQDALETAIKRLTEEPGWTDRALAHAVRVARDPDPLAAVVVACNALLRGVAPSML